MESDAATQRRQRTAQRGTGFDVNTSSLFNVFDFNGSAWCHSAPYPV